MPRELVGRLSTVRFLSALGEDALRRIVQGNKCKEYGLMLPHGAHFAIDQSAEDLIVANALSAHYGARSVNRQINEIFFGDLWRALSEIEWVKSVSLTAPDGKLGFMIEQGEGTPPRVEPVEGGTSCGVGRVRPSAQSAQLPGRPRRGSDARYAQLTWR